MLDIWNETFGQIHHNYFETMKLWASSYKKESKYGKEIKLLVEVFDTQNEIYGPRHEESLRIIKDLYSTYK